MRATTADCYYVNCKGTSEKKIYVLFISEMENIYVSGSECQHDGD